MNAGELPKVTATAEGCGDCRKLRWVAGEVRNMTENALSILIVIFTHNSNKPGPQTESCVFSAVVRPQGDPNSSCPLWAYNPQKLLFLSVRSWFQFSIMAHSWYWTILTGLEKIPINEWLVTLLYICGVIPTLQSLETQCRYRRKLRVTADIAAPSINVSASSTDAVTSNG